MIYPLPFPELTEPLNILVVDDQAFDRKIICTRLREVAPPDTDIAEAASASEVLLAVAEDKRPFDCILLDMNMPSLHGVDACTIVLNIEPKIPTVMITAEADMEKALQCLKAGAEDFIIKGEYSNIGLYRAIRYAIERHRTTAENSRLSDALAKEQTLIEAQREFIHLVSHEFRTPLSIISGASQLLGLKAPALREGEGATQFKKIGDALHRLEGLLDNVTRLSLAEEGKDMFTPARFDIAEAMLQTVDAFNEAHIECAVPGQPLFYYGDRRLVEYALHNVISNALKYSPAGTPVRVSVRPSDLGIEISVADKGYGMSPAAIARAGEKFYRHRETSHIEGTGLGIHLAHRFIGYHHGALTFESERGRGTRVRLFLPLPSPQTVAA